MSSSNCCFLPCIQISQEAGQVVWYSHLFQNFPQSIVIHTVKGFGIVKKAEINVFSGTLLLIWWSSGCWQFGCCSSAFSKITLNIWKFTVHILLKPGLENFEHYFTSMWDECNFAVVWHCLSLDLEWTLTFSSPVATAEFSKFADILSAALSQNHLLGFEVAQQIDGETVETVADFILGGSQITTDGDCIHEIKRCLLLGRKLMTKLDSILKIRQ